MPEIPSYSTREIVLDHAGRKAFGHNPSWVKASDFNRIIEDMKKLTAAIVKHSPHADSWWSIEALTALAEEQADKSRV